MGVHAVEIEGLGKRYRLGEGADYLTLREALGSLARRRRSATTDSSHVWALQDVSLTVDEGEAVGVIGRNGAGKTTLLKILARITEPTTGVARTRGRVGSLLEVGTGFHLELTGQENIYLNGAVLGMSRRDIRRRFDEIVEFAGVERFLDTPLKRYSAGMSLRLAFAVAAHLEPEIILVDEVLAVGDAEFQRRCLGKMSSLTGEGRTVIFVSHDLGTVVRLCDRAVWIEGGVEQADGPADEIVDLYLHSVVEGEVQAELAVDGSAPVEVRSVAITPELETPSPGLRRDRPFSVRIRTLNRIPVPELDVGISIRNQKGVPVLDETWSDAGSSREGLWEPGEHEAVLTIPGVLSAGEYVVAIWLGVEIGQGEYETYFDREVVRFQLLPAPEDRRASLERPRTVQPPVAWRLEAPTRQSGASAQ